MGKRQAGLGTVYRRADGRSKGQIRIPGGRRRSFYAPSRRDLIHKLADARWTLGEGLPVSAGTQSLHAYLEYWLMMCRTRHRPITLVTYARDLRRLTNVLGEIPLRRLTPGLIQSEAGSVFTNRHGAPVGPGVVNRALAQALRDAGLPHIRVHDLRHSTARILLEAGTHAKGCEDSLGHSNIRLTLDTYSHVTPALHQ